MEEFIARENIRRLEAQIEACTDSKQRATLERLLDAERQRLTEVLSESRSRPESS